MEWGLLYLPEVLETVMKFLDSSSRKSLAQTCKHFLKVYRHIYFPHGLHMRPLGIKNIQTDNGKCAICRKHKYAYWLGFLAEDHNITYKTYCRSKVCQIKDFDTSMRVMRDLIWADGLQNRYLFCDNAIDYAHRMSEIDNRTIVTRHLLHDQMIGEIALFHQSSLLGEEAIIESCAINAKAHILAENLPGHCITSFQ